MMTAKEGDTVKVHYTGRLPDGTTFDASDEQEPLEFTLGAGEVIPGFEAAVLGMTPGESKTATVAADAAYGPHDDEMILQVDREQFPANIEPQVGQRLQVRQDQGETFSVVVTEITPDSVTLDANHPLAGQDLTFDIQLVEIAAAG
jgi:FKBP-type peptidyl-prolyl cis-trans isomerase 2